MKINIKAVFFIISASITMNMRFWGENIPLYFRVGIETLWVFYFLINWTHTTNSSSKIKIAINYRLMSIPIFVIAAYAFVIWMFNPEIQIRNYTRLISTCLQLLLAWGFGASGYYFFKDKAIDLMFVAGTLSYIIGSVLCVICQFGLSDFLAYIVNLLLGKENPKTIEFIMEVHDLTFSMGLYFLFYSFSDKRNNRYKKVFLSILLIFLGLKRIEILALVVTISIYYLLLKSRKTIQYRALFIAICYLIVCFSYIYIIKFGILGKICNELSINTMSRTSYYSFSSKFFEFSPLYTGSGFTYFRRMWGELRNSGFRLDGYGLSASPHSDMLIFYIENGFVLTIGWIFYSFNERVKRLTNFFGNEIAECYLLLTMYMFILYLTDNTFTYAGTQMVYLVIPMCECYITRQKNTEEN